MKKILLSLTENQHTTLTGSAAEYNISLSELIRRALDFYIESTNKKYLIRCPLLANSVIGPKLSKKIMKGNSE